MSYGSFSHADDTNWPKSSKWQLFWHAFRLSASIVSGLFCVGVFYGIFFTRIITILFTSTVARGMRVSLPHSLLWVSRFISSIFFFFIFFCFFFMFLLFFPISVLLFVPILCVPIHSKHALRPNFIQTYLLLKWNNENLFYTNTSRLDR